jgi:hypothetical protein
MKVNLRDAIKSSDSLPESIPNLDYPQEKPRNNYYGAVPSTHRYTFLKKIMQTESNANLIGR